MKVYVLLAKGALRSFNGVDTILSKKAFLVREAAEAYSPEFLKKCTHSTGPSSLCDLGDDAKVQVSELEVE